METKLFGIGIADLCKIAYDLAERNAAGQYIPPMLIFLRQRMKQELMDGTPPAPVSACHQSGWMQGQIFVKRFRHFIDRVKPTEKIKIAKLFGSAFAKAATEATAMNAFAKTGIWPLNENVFSYVDFAASDVTKRGLHQAAFNVTPKDICAVPKGQCKETKRKRGTSAVLTSTPYQIELEANQNSSVKSVKRKVKFGNDNPGKQDKLQGEKRLNPDPDPVAYILLQ
ncbi:hypothetical protein ILUMI_27050 [Ignelater luminosus]|uniref:Uncharacterized protein n=1 Tax=Ignelater luminosus TaxID=2038154 RepID=A0A8K0FVS3_IGNLU|nr:hypothetical protein ILUMI_27050 [Ignelater luminosus]